MDYKLLTKAQVAELLTVKPITIDKMRKQGDFLRPIKVGKTLRWRDVDILAWLNQKFTDAETR